MSGTTRRAWLAALAAALVLGAGLRFHRSDWGRPHHLFHPDEARISYAIGDIDRQAAGLAARIARGERPTLRERIDAFNPRFFAYGSLPLYLIRSTHRLLRGSDLFTVGRAWSAFFDTITILLVFLLGRRLYGARAGALASLFFAFTVFHVQLSHFLTVDVMLASLVTATLWACALVMGEGRIRHSLLAGLLAGLAMATKASAAPLVVPILVAHAAARPRGGAIRPARRLGTALASLLAAAGVFLVCEPFFLLDHAEFMRQLREQKNMVSGNWAPPWTLQYEHTVRGFYQLRNLVAYCMGPPLGLAVLSGTGYLLARWLRRPSRGTLLLLAWVVPVGAATLSFRVKFLRYLAPLIPFLCLLGAQGLCLLHDRIRGRAGRLAVRAVAGIAVASSLFYAAAFARIYGREDPRVRASDWIYEHLPRGSRILNETWEFGGLPTGTRRGTPGIYTVRQLDIYRPDDRGKARAIAEELEKADAVAIPTKRMYGSVLRVPEKYPVTSNYYRLLFGGRLGFRLEEGAVSYPRLMGVTFNDDFADESFTVYDHPKALVFRKTVPLPRAYLERLIAASPGIDYWPVLEDALGATAENRPAPLEESLGACVTADAPPPPRRAAAATIAWLAAVTLLGLAAAPLAGALLGNLADRGWALSRTLAVAVTGYLVWLAASIGAAPFSRPLILAAAGLVALLSAACARRPRAPLSPAGRSGIVAAEALFFGTFLLFLLFRLFNPDIFCSESSMDFSFINSVLRSRTFPLIDPWTSGTYLNYYYYGHYLAAMLMRLAGVPAEVGYNLAFCLVPALVASGVFSIGHTLTGRIRWGLAAAAAACFIGNLDGLVLLADMGAWREAFHRLLPLAVPTNAEHVFRFFRCAHEVIPRTVHEFPLWSFIFVDLHAHVIAMPFSVLLLAIALNLALAPRPGLGAFGGGPRGVCALLLAAVVLGMTVPTNTWDFPVYLGVIGLSLLLNDAARGAGRPLSSHSVWWDCGLRARIVRCLLSAVRLEGAPGLLPRLAVRTLAPAAALAALSLAAYAPLFAFFGREGMGLGLVGDLTTPLQAFIRFFGLFLFIIASFLAAEIARGGGRRVAAGAALAAAALLPWAIFALKGTRDYATLSATLLLLLPGALVLAARRRDRRTAWAIALALCGLAVVVFCELAHIRDFYGEGPYKRFNTVFKFYIAAWFFFSIAAAPFLARLFARPAGRRAAPAAAGRCAWRAALALLAASSLVFTVMGPRARTIGDDTYPRVSLAPPRSALLGRLFPRLLARPTLDGLAWLRERLPGEYAAIRWLNEAVAGQPVIMEDTGADYLYEFGRVSSNTGLPTVLGWWSHVDQRGYRRGEERRKDVFKFYRSADPVELAALIAKYDIRLVFVGHTERKRYRPEELAKFDLLDGLFRPVFRCGQVTVYATRPFGGAAAAPAAEAGERPPPPRVSILQGGRGEGPGQFDEPRGIATDAAGNVYVADFRNHRIQKFDADGFFVTSWGEEGEYPGLFRDPCGVAAAPDGRVYVADTFNHRVQAFDPDGKYLDQFEGGFFAPRGIAVDAEGRVWVADTGNGVVKLLSADGRLLKTIGRKGSGEGEFDCPTGIAIDDGGNIYVADAGNRRVRILDREGNLAGGFPVDGWAAAVFNEPYIAAAGGDIYLTDPTGHRVLRYAAEGRLTGVLAPREGAAPLLSFPMGIAVAKGGEALYVADCRNHMVRRFPVRDWNSPPSQ
ncbi:MAG: DUF2298 domain-containing protein [bacterium]|nr:DUF2298 domain-containing protein [bacterium]